MWMHNSDRMNYITLLVVYYQINPKHFVFHSVFHCALKHKNSYFGVENKDTRRTKCVSRSPLPIELVKKIIRL